MITLLALLFVIVTFVVSVVVFGLSIILPVIDVAVAVLVIYGIYKLCTSF